MIDNFEIVEGKLKKCRTLSKICIVPEGVTEIAPAAFEGAICEKIILPESLTNIDRQAFVYCNYLEEIVLPKNLVNIGEYAFMYCKNLKSISLPDSVVVLGRGAFYDCTSLTNVNLGKVENIYGMTFYNCLKLKTLESKYVKHLFEDALANTSKLVSIDFPKVEQIEHAAIDATSLTELILPDSLNFISTYFLSEQPKVPGFKIRLSRFEAEKLFQTCDVFMHDFLSYFAPIQHTLDELIEEGKSLENINKILIESER